MLCLKMKKNRKTIALNEELYEMLDYIAQKQHEEWDTPSKNLTYTISIMIKSSYKNYKNKYGSKSINKDIEQKDHEEQVEDDWVTKQEKEYRKRLEKEKNDNAKITKMAIKENEDWRDSEEVKDLMEEIANWKLKR